MSNKPRRPWLAALLTLLTTGLGHLYAGKLKRGIVLFGIGEFLVLIFAVAFDVIAPNVFFILFAIAVGIIFIVFCVSDAIAIAKRNRENYEPAKCNRWFAYVGYIVFVALFNHIYTSVFIIPFFIQAYNIPVASMEPTLLIGDHIIVNKHIYKTSMPKRGDVVVFKYPENPKVEYLKRLIGEPGDTIEIAGRTVFINGKPLKENYVQYIDSGSIDAHFGPVHIPSGNYFVLGDNRDNSADSRYWGFLPRENLTGKPLFIYWSYETPPYEYRESTIFENPRWVIGRFLSPFTKTRWNRTFRIIR
jgi:signal peptidase I